jgi:hypothetical protein
MHNTTTMSPSPPPHTDRALPEDRSRSSHSSRSSRSSQSSRSSRSSPCRIHRVRRVHDHIPARRRHRHVVIRHCCRPGPPPPMGNRRRFRGGQGGVVVVVDIRVRAPHVIKETPGFIFVRMGEDNRPSPTTTRHVLPLWRRRRDAVRRGRRQDGRHGAAAAGLGIF